MINDTEFILLSTQYIILNGLIYYMILNLSYHFVYLSFGYNTFMFLTILYQLHKFDKSIKELKREDGRI